MARAALDEVRAGLSARLGARRTELEQGIFARIRVVTAASEAEDEEYVEGIRRAVSAGVGHALAGVEREEGEMGPVPDPLLAQARRAARSGIAPDVILRRCFAGYATFGEFIMDEAEDGAAIEDSALRTVLHAQAALFEGLVVSIMDEYVRERGGSDSPKHRQLQLVRKILAAEPVDPGELAYTLNDWHIGVVARGDRAATILRQVADIADRRLLLVCPDQMTVWAWFGGQRRVGSEEISKCVPSNGTGDALIALGEPARGVNGWRLTHEQASAALQVSRPGGDRVVRYADVGLLASLAQDHVLADSLHQIYLAPLSDGRDGGATLRDTLRAYFNAGRNTSSTAAALGVSRQTVGNRLRAIEEKLDRTIESCAPEIEIALRLENGLSDS